MRFFTSASVKAAAFASIMLAAGNAAANETDGKYYLSDVYTVEDLNSDILGVPMRADHVEGTKYEARYYNEKANNPVYLLGTKTDFSDVMGDDGTNSGNLAFGSSIEEVSPIVLAEAGKYYKIEFDTNECTYSVETYEVTDDMDPIFWEYGSNNYNYWHTWATQRDDDRKPWDNDNYEHAEESWLRPVLFGYTCTEYLINDNAEYVDAQGNVIPYDEEAGIGTKEDLVKAKKLNAFAKWDYDHSDDPAKVLPDSVDADQLVWIESWTPNPNNKHQYIWDAPKHFVKGQSLNFIIHNPNEHGWWNYITWRVDDPKECDIFYYYGNVVKQAYLDWKYGKDAVSYFDWYNSEDVRRQAIYDGGSDNWCKPEVPATGEYVMVFDTHLGRAKIVPADKITDGIAPIVSEQAAAATNAPVEYYNLQGMRVNPDAMAPGIYVRRQGNVSTKVIR